MTTSSKDEGKLSNLVICLFSYESKHNSEYIELLRKFKVKVVETENEEHCLNALHSTECNGILVDILTYIRASIYTKELIAHIEDIYPAARIRYNPESKDMELTNLSKRSQLPLQDFLENYCACFDARRLRKHKRLLLNLNLRLSWEHEGKPQEFLCTSVNVSESGLFIVDKSSDLNVMDSVKIQIMELSEDHFLQGTVVRKLGWGERHFHAPGFGIRIDHIDSEIHEDFMKLTQRR